MTELQQKINLIRQYIYDRKGVDIGTIKFEDNDASRELRQVDFAYKKAVEYYTNK